MYGITMDGRLYDIELIEVNINVEFLYKYAERLSTTGELKSEALGTFENQVLVIGPGDNALNPDYLDFLEELMKIQTDGTYNHDVEVLSPFGRYTFEMYPSAFQLRMKRLKDGGNRDTDTKYWSNTTITFTATKRRE